MLDVAFVVPGSTLAFATTVHVAMLVLRKHRTPVGVVPWAILPSLAFSVSPWLWQTAGELATGLGLHIIWFIACERLVPVARAASPSAAAARGTAARQTSAPADGGARPTRGFVPLSVLAVVDETPTIRTFRLRRPEGLAFAAGQFLTVRVQVDGVPHVRCYSVSSAPEATGYLEISVKRQGLVSGALHATVRPGSEIHVKAPAGHFVYPAGDDRPIVLVAGGVGITPVMGMLRHAVAAEPLRPVTLVYSARGREEVAYGDELATLVRRHPEVRVVLTLTDPAGTSRIRKGRIDAALLREAVPNPAAAVFLMCGPAGMIRDLEEALLAMGVPKGQVRYEVFQPSRAIGADAAAYEPAVAAGHAEHELTLVRSGRSVPVKGSQTLLDAAEGAGADLPSVCRAGVCGTCRTRLLTGEATCTSDALDDRDRADGWVLPCVTYASGDCSLDA